MDARKPPEPAKRPRRFLVRLGWALLICGLALCGYAYFVKGTPSLINWASFLPLDEGDAVPNLEAEIGMMLFILGCIPLYWDLWRSK